MTAITVSQPYASPVASCQKWGEHRTWETGYRGPLAIHAWSGIRYMTLREIRAAGRPVGAMIATTRLVACVPLLPRGALTAEDKVTTKAAGVSAPAFLRHEHVDGTWCCVPADIRTIDPVPCRGRLGLWDWDPAARPTGATA
jgi:hypothetical protein